MPPRCKNPNAPTPGDPGWLHYVEPYFGGGSVLLANDPEGISEVANDKNQKLVNFWQVLRDPATFEQFRRYAEASPFGEPDFAESRDWLLRYGDAEGLQVPRAFNFFVLCRQSLAGRMDCLAPLSKNRTRRGMNEQASGWLNAVEGLPAVHGRLKRIVILHGEALDVIRQQDGPRTLFYLDPPYLHETRVETAAYGEYEMTKEQHGELLAALSIIKGQFLLSGYRSKVYDDCARLNGWICREKQISNHASGQRIKPVKTEIVWMNYAPGLPVGAH